MRTFMRAAAMLMFAVIASGCTVGLIYTHTREPLTIDHHTTLAAGTDTTGDIKHIQVSWVGIKWGDAALGDIAKEKGLHELYYADLEYLSVLTILMQSTVHLYGR
jgi:hypothetical protein